MITLQEFCAYLDQYLDCRAFTDYGPNGLQVEGKNKLKKIATAVSASQATIEEAIACGADALIVHHGMFWNRDPYEVVGVKKDKIKLLLENNVSLLAYHLPLDAHSEVGNNWKAAKDLGWKNIEPFEIKGVPLGVKGDFSELQRQAFQAKLETYYNHSASCALGGPHEVQSAVLISGGAHWNIKEAVQEGVDCFITGSFDEPIWHIAHEEKINFYALGHSATERIGPQALGDHLKREFGLDVQFLDIPNPF